MIILAAALIIAVIFGIMHVQSGTQTEARTVRVRSSKDDQRKRNSRVVDD